MDAEGDERIHRIRHSLAHVLAQAVIKLRPGATLGFGPPIDDGFYYDFVLPEPITEDDFPAIEKEMRRIIGARQPFSVEAVAPSDAYARLESMGEPYKRAYAEDLVERQGEQSLTFYTNGPFVDMCEGPHVAHTGELPPDAFRLRSVAGAYWRGDHRNAMMTRIYAWAFGTRDALEAHVKTWKEAQERDHKKLGKELDLFVIDDEVGKGLPLWLPNGSVVRDELQKLAEELEFQAGYQRVHTPQLARESLYYKTGHLPYYAPHMYPAMELREVDDAGNEVVREAYRLRPMNCPHHHRIYAARPRSYRDLPLRLAEYGHVFRYEDSGALSGLLRVRGMCMNDAHIYCTVAQCRSEFVSVMDLHRRAYAILGLTDYYMRLSTWDPDDPKGRQKFVDDPENWASTEQQVREAMAEVGLPTREVKGEAAFYGPKIDVQFRTVTGREETASTNQLDFAIPRRLGLVYRGSDNAEHHPMIIHRAPLGTHERFVAFLIEHFAGAFPTWLAPVQVRVITVSERFDEAASAWVADLRSRRVRAELDDSNESMGKKIRIGAMQKVPNLAVIGERELAEGTVALRRHGSRDQRVMPRAEFEARLDKAIRERSDSAWS
jgi:threonyl-tRNA synthetase